MKPFSLHLLKAYRLDILAFPQNWILPSKACADHPKLFFRNFSLFLFFCYPEIIQHRLFWLLEIRPSMTC